MSLVNILTEYRNNVTECNNLISFAHARYRSGGYKLQRATREFVVESTFLKIFISWETFLEKSFHSYLLGNQSILGNAPVKYASPLNDEHAQKLLVGTQKYVDWANPEIVRKLSQLYFDNGYVFNSQLSSINSELLDMRTIRNAAAHMSSTTSNKLDGLGQRLLNRPCNNISVYDLILSINPNSQSGDTFLTEYTAMLDISAEAIANG